MKHLLPDLRIVLLLVSTAATQPVQAQATNPVVIGGFDYIRAGDASFPIGASFSEARSAILSNYPATTFTNITTLAASNLAGVDILIIATPATITNDISPLTTEEQTALLDFVNTGGSAVLFTDNDSFSPLAYAANSSFLAPFGMGSIGTLISVVTGHVMAPLQHVVTSGPFGIVSNFTQYVPGVITNLGPYATSLATNYDTNITGSALAVIDPGVIVPGSGPVVVFADVSGFWDTDGYFPENETLFLNVIDYCRQAPQGWRLKIELRGPNVVLHWPVEATNLVLQAATNLATVTAWTEVTNTPSVGGGENYVTNAVLGKRFYRLKG